MRIRKIITKKLIFLFIILNFFINTKIYSSDFNNILKNENYYNIANSSVDLGEKVFHELEVKNEEIFSHNSSNDINKCFDIWKCIKEIVPSRYLNYISKLKLYTDGYENTLAYVTSDINRDNKWMICVDINDSFKNDGVLKERIKETIMHEFMHIITLNNSQMDNSNTSKTYTIAEGKLKEDAILNDFYNRFWSKHEDYVKKEESIKPYSEEYNILTNNFYSLNKDEFITKYASSNPVEDIAETFIYFIKSDIPLDNSIKSQKIRFLYTYTELIDIKNFILNNCKTTL